MNKSIDFTLNTYLKLLNTLNNQGFSFSTFEEFISGYKGKVITLRHDVDTSPENSLQFARILEKSGIKGTYYFRIVPQSYDERIIKKIFSLGHEVGYHYEDLSFAWAKLGAQGSGLRAQGKELEKLVVDIGIKSFIHNLGTLRKIVPVRSICMHGSPMNRWDSRLLWKYYDYHDFGLIGEPYFDVDFNEVLYLTDTGRRWDGGGVSIRDKASSPNEREKGRKGEGEKNEEFSNWKAKSISGSLMNITQKAVDFQNKYKFKSTSDIIRTAEIGELPDRIMMTFHPQRWTDKSGLWMRELVWQNVKNVWKYFLIKVRSE